MCDCGHHQVNHSSVSGECHICSCLYYQDDAVEEEMQGYVNQD